MFDTRDELPEIAPCCRLFQNLALLEVGRALATSLARCTRSGTIIVPACRSASSVKPRDAIFVARRERAFLRNEIMQVAGAQVHDYVEKPIVLLYLSPHMTQGV